MVMAGGPKRNIDQPPDLARVPHHDGSSDGAYLGRCDLTGDTDGRNPAEKLWFLMIFL